MTPHETASTTTPRAPRATAPPPRTFAPQGPTLGDLSDAYLQDYQVRQFRSVSTARGRVAHLTAFFGRVVRAAALTTHQIRQYQLARRAAGAATGTINRETSALHRMCTLAVHWGWLDTVPGFPDRLRENPPRQGFFEHPEYLAVRAYLPAPWQDILDLAYYSGWRKQEILGLTWDEIDRAGGVIRLSPARSKTLVNTKPTASGRVTRRASSDPACCGGKRSRFPFRGRPFRARKENLSMHDWQSLAHVRWECKYHVVIIPKFRRKILYGQLRKQVGRILRALCDQRGVELLEGKAMADHVHLCLSIPRSTALRTRSAS